MRKIVVYGIGKIGKKYIDVCIENEVEGLILADSNDDLWGYRLPGNKDM